MLFLFTKTSKHMAIFDSSYLLLLHRREFQFHGSCVVLQRCHVLSFHSFFSPLKLISFLVLSIWYGPRLEWCFFFFVSAQIRMATTVLPGYATLAIKIPWYGSPYDWQFSQYSSIPQLQLMIGKTDAATYTFIAKIKKKKDSSTFFIVLFSQNRYIS